MAIHVRERPPLRLHIDAEAPSGKHYRWALDEPKAENVFSGLRFSDTMPGGFESMDCSLPRKPGISYSDLERLSTLSVIGAGGEIAAEHRLERAPRASGDQMSVSPGAVGWQAHLDDNKSASGIYVDRDSGAWGGAGRARQAALVGTNQRLSDHTVRTDNASSLPALTQVIALEGNSIPIAEAWYDAGPSNKLGSVYYNYDSANVGTSGSDANWQAYAQLCATDAGPTVASANLLATLNGAGYFTPAAGSYRYALFQFMYSSTLQSGPGLERLFRWYIPAVYGDHGLARRGSDPGGFYASDVVAHAVTKWAPLLTVTQGVNGTVRPSSFIIPHLAFREPTTAAEMVRQASRFELPYWGVWENKEFRWDASRTPRKRWRARVAPAQLQETGPQVDRLWESVIVQYQDIDGTARTVGPPGSGADVQDAVLKDADPDNPANRLEIVRRDLLQMGTSVAAAAVEVGRRFLEETKQLDSSGQARLVGHVEDDRGVLHPYWKVRAGDEISFVDSASPAYRRIVRTEKDHASRTCSVDLDAPPEGLQALLERLGVVLVPLGVG